MSAVAQGCRASASRVESALRRMAACQSSPPVGGSISPNTTSTMASSSSSRLAT